MLVLLAFCAIPTYAQPLAMTLENGVATAAAGGLEVFEYHFGAELPKPFIHR